MSTTPGFTMESKKFSLKFLSASQQGTLCHLLEYETDWKEVMQIILDCLEAFPTDKTQVEMVAQKKLEEWTLTQEGGDDLELKVGVIISERRYYQENRLKSLRLIFSDMFKTVVRFNVIKKKVMKTLKSFSAEAVSSCISYSEDIYKLGIPRGLFVDLDTAYNDSWRDKQLPHLVMSDFIMMSMDIQE